MENYKKFEELIKNSAIKNTKKSDKNKTIFEVTQYPHREKVASNIFAFYFDINEEHNWQDIFLEALFNAINKKYDNTDILKVDPEFRTLKGNYIDIVLTGENFVIGIENKINASLYNDLEDYYDTIKSIAEEKPIYAIVLSASKLSDLDTKKIEDLKRKKIEYKNILYSELFDKIDILLKEKNIKDNKWLMFYNEFKKTIKKRNDENMEDDKIDEDLKNFYIKNKDDIKNFTSCLYDLKGKLNKKADKLKEKIEQMLNEEKINENNLVVWHYNYNQNLNEVNNNNNLYTICNIFLKEYKITIDNVITPENWYIQIHTGTQQNKYKIREILEKNKIEYKSTNKLHIQLLENYNEENNEIIKRDIKLIRIFNEELSQKDTKEK